MNQPSVTSRCIPRLGLMPCTWRQCWRDSKNSERWNPQRFSGKNPGCTFHNWRNPSKKSPTNGPTFNTDHVQPECNFSLYVAAYFRGRGGKVVRSSFNFRWNPLNTYISAAFLAVFLPVSASGDSDTCHFWGKWPWQLARWKRPWGEAPIFTHHRKVHVYIYIYIKYIYIYTNTSNIYIYIHVLYIYVCVNAAYILMTITFLPLCRSSYSFTHIERQESWLQFKPWTLYGIAAKKKRKLPQSSMMTHFPPSTSHYHLLLTSAQLSCPA